MNLMNRRKPSKSESSSVTTGSTSISVTSQPPVVLEDPGYPAVRCSIYVFESSASPTPAQAFQDCARQYQLALTGKWTLGDVCDHNASIALKYGRGFQVIIYLF